jgi:hypothetical protein
MNVQCGADRLSTASRFDEWQPFARFQGHAENVGQLAISEAVGEFEAITSNFEEIDDNVGMGLINGPGPDAAVTAYSFDYLGPGESLL